MNPIRLAIITGLILTFLVSLAAYPVLPDQVVSHWNAAGVPDGSMGKPAGIGLIPLIMIALVALLLFLPRIDPLRKNYAAFRDWYDGFILAFVLFMLAIQCQVILWSLRYRELCRGAGSGSCHLVHPGPGVCGCACHGCLFVLRLPEGAGKILKTIGCIFPGR
jgi:uncharacterized membrane protein